jgi:hypothetical protein
MRRRLTDDDRDKEVVTYEGQRIGTIWRVHDGRATVRRAEDDDGGLSEKVLEFLGWSDDDDDDEIRDEHVDRVENGRVHLNRL